MRKFSAVALGAMLIIGSVIPVNVITANIPPIITNV